MPRHHSVREKKQLFPFSPAETQVWCLLAAHVLGEFRFSAPFHPETLTQCHDCFHLAGLCSWCNLKKQLNGFKILWKKQLKFLLAHLMMDPLACFRTKTIMVPATDACSGVTGSARSPTHKAPTRRPWSSLALESNQENRCLRYFHFWSETSEWTMETQKQWENRKSACLTVFISDDEWKRDSLSLLPS